MLILSPWMLGELSMLVAVESIPLVPDICVSCYDLPFTEFFLRCTESYAAFLKTLPVPDAELSAPLFLSSFICRALSIYYFFLAAQSFAS